MMMMMMNSRRLVLLVSSMLLLKLIPSHAFTTTTTRGYPQRRQSTTPRRFAINKKSNIEEASLSSSSSGGDAPPRIIQAGLEHLEELTDLFEGYREFYKQPLDRSAAKKFLQERIEKDESVIYLALDDTAEGNNAAVGFTQLYPLFSSTRMKKLWLLNDLYVSKDARKAGYGVALIDRAKELCRATGACEIMLETAADNVVGNNLYPKMGFELSDGYNFYSWEPK